MKKAIAMKCSQRDWDSIKKYFIDTDILITESEPYLVNNYANEELKIMNLTSHCKDSNNRTVHETFNAKIFLNACGIETDVFEITKEQLLRLHRQGNHYTKCELDYLFPDAFKKELIIGKWYKNKDTNSIIFSQGFYNTGNYNGVVGYGIDMFENWVENYNIIDCIEATPQEIEAALVCEAKRRGYKSKVVCVGFGFNQNCALGKGQKQCFENNILTYMGCDIFQDGQWAQIIETITIQEAEKLLNKKIV